jgi:hypothetical protein
VKFFCTVLLTSCTAPVHCMVPLTNCMVPLTNCMVLLTNSKVLLTSCSCMPRCKGYKYMDLLTNTNARELSIPLLMNFYVHGLGFKFR